MCLGGGCVFFPGTSFSEKLALAPVSNTSTCCMYGPSGWARVLVFWGRGSAFARARTARHRPCVPCGMFGKLALPSIIDASTFMYGPSGWACDIWFGSAL